MPEELLKIKKDSEPAALAEGGSLEEGLYDEGQSEWKNDHARARSKLLLEGLEQDKDERKDYAKRIFSLCVWWLLATLAVVVCSGVNRVDFQLDNSVLIALITGLSIDVLALFIIVTKYLFPNRDSR